MSPEEMYKQLYLKQFRANEEAMRILEQAQQECEEFYIQNAPDEDDEEE